MTSNVDSLGEAESLNNSAQQAFHCYLKQRELYKREAKLYAGARDECYYEGLAQAYESAASILKHYFPKIKGDV